MAVPSMAGGAPGPGSGPRGSIPSVCVANLDPYRRYVNGRPGGGSRSGEQGGAERGDPEGAGGRGEAALRRARLRRRRPRRTVRAAGVTKGALYHHFGSKEGLFREVL